MGKFARLCNIFKNWGNIELWKREIRKGIAKKIIGPLFFRSNNGVHVIDEEWDNLIILDACRFDLFEDGVKNWDIEGKLESRISRGSDTAAFLLENFLNISKK